MLKQFEAAEKREKEANAALAAEENKDRSLREQHVKDLEKLEHEENVVEKDDVAYMAKDDKDIAAAEDKMKHAQHDLSKEEADEARVLREEADAITQKAEKSKG